MYSGTTLRSSSGKVLGAHQKIDRVARRALAQVAPELPFPGIKAIVHFEGMNGPDGLKRKSPARDEPWHYYNPANPDDTAILTMILDHRANLIKAISEHNRERAAFEAAWMAHAIVDGLTPAHHAPLEEAIEQLRGEGIETRTTIYKKLVYPGNNPRERFRNNWYVWGAGGVMTTHSTYEWGVATSIASLKLQQGYPDKMECQRVVRLGIDEIFQEAASKIYSMKMYTTFQKKGWTSKLARQTREVLAPLIVKVVALAWYEAAYQAHQLERGTSKP
ncbi:hypothetical protein JNJ66_03055 [Candidatus Saccharibacteria bacterium]|nr:hypothetical protein [Candidatus Saccharibacteria bacterium]